MTKQLLSKADIMKAQDIVCREIEVPEWGGAVLMRSMSGKERADFEAAVQSRRKGNNQFDMVLLREMLIAVVLVNSDGERLFTDGEITELGKKSSKVIERLFEEAQDMNGIGAEAVKELEENLDGGPSDKDGSD